MCKEWEKRNVLLKRMLCLYEIFFKDAIIAVVRPAMYMSFWLDVRRIWISLEFHRILLLSGLFPSFYITLAIYLKRRGEKKKDFFQGGIMKLKVAFL